MRLHELREAWASWIRRHFWDLFATLTFAEPIHPEQAAKRFIRWIRDIERREGHRVGWVRALEYQRRSVIHFHALVSGVAHADPYACMARWNDIGGGYARIEAYDPTRGAAFYLTKHLGRGAEIDIGGPLKLIPAKPEHLDPDQHDPPDASPALEMQSGGFRLELSKEQIDAMFDNHFGSIGHRR